MNRRQDQDKDSDAGSFILLWIVATVAVVLVMYGAILIARQEGMNGDVTHGGQSASAEP